MLIRLLSFNIHKGVGWRIRKSTLGQIKTEICTLHPDIILLQEVQGHQLDTLAAELWPHQSYGKNAVYSEGHHGNAILSKFPILFSENIDLTMHRYERRGLLYSKVHLPNKNHFLHLFSVHLGLYQVDRYKQIDKIIEFIESIGKQDPIILGGDFNDWNSFASKPIINYLGFHEAFLNHQGSYARTYPAWSPVFKLDRIYVRGLSVKQAERMTNKSWRYLSDHLAIEVQLKL